LRLIITIITNNNIRELIYQTCEVILNYLYLIIEPADQVLPH